VSLSDLNNDHENQRAHHRRMCRKASIEANERQGTFSWGKLGQQFEGQGGSETLAMLNDHPLLVVGTFGDGRSVAWTSDIGPHWCPREFVDWIGYSEVWARIIRWLCKDDE
jgi:hypothetical protein